MVDILLKLQYRNNFPMRKIPQHKSTANIKTLPQLRQSSLFGQYESDKQCSSLKSTILNFNSTQYKQRKPKKSLSRLQLSLQKHRSEFQQLSRTNHKQFNTTFFKQQRLEDFYQQKQRLQKKKMQTMQKQLPLFNTHQFANSHIKTIKNRPSLLNDKKNKQSLIAIDYFIEMSWLKHQCYDSIFYKARVGATMNYYNDELYLFGGSPDNSETNLVFHKFKMEANEWKHVNSIGSLSSRPVLSLMYHQSAMYRENLVFCGGISIEKKQLKKTFNPNIYSFNTVSQTWSQYNWSKCLKHHSSCMTFNWLIVHGGINDKQSTESMIHIVQLNFTGNFQLSKTSSFQSNLPLSHHKMITTFNQDNLLRFRLRVDGLLLFGGKNQNQELSNELFYLDSKEIKLPGQSTKTLKKWEPLNVMGQKPQKRMAHTFQLLKNKGLAVLIGGINERNQYLSDIWILELFGLSWTQVDQVPLLAQTGGIAYHCSCINESQIYIYGGLTKENVDKQFYLIQTQKYRRQASKIQSRKLDAESISFKGFQ